MVGKRKLKAKIVLRHEHRNKRKGFRYYNYDPRA